MAETSANLGYAITTGLFLILALVAIVAWQMKQQVATEERHRLERETEATRHGEERKEWQQTQSALLARFAEAQEKFKDDMLLELRDQTRVLISMATKDGISILASRPPATPEPPNPLQ